MNKLRLSVKEAILYEHIFNEWKDKRNYLPLMTR